VIKNGFTIIERMPRLSVWRAPTDNDSPVKGKWYGERLDRLAAKVYGVEKEHGEKSVIFKVKGSLCAPSKEPAVYFTTVYTITPSGEIVIALDAEVRENIEQLPRLGFEFFMPSRCGYLEYFGLGPEENYADLRSHVKMGLYKSTAAQQFFPYLRPQEHGNHGNVKYLSVHDERGRGLEFTSEQPFEFAASEYTAEELTRAAHPHELRKSGFTVVRVDYKVNGIGTGSCGPYTLEKYWLSEKKINFSFKIRVM